MITKESRDASAEFADDNLEVRVVLRVAEASDVSMGRILNTLDEVIAGALTTMGKPGVAAALAIWHESRAVEARESEAF